MTELRSAATCSSSCLTRRDSSAPKDEEPSVRSEEHTSELQSRLHLVCRLLLEKKKIITRLLSFLSGRLPPKSPTIPQFLRNGSSAQLPRPCTQFFPSFSTRICTQLRDGLVMV